METELVVEGEDLEDGFISVSLSKVDQSFDHEESKLDSVHASEQSSIETLIGNVSSPEIVSVGVSVKVSICTNSSFAESPSFPKSLEFLSAKVLASGVHLLNDLECQLLEIDSLLLWVLQSELLKGLESLQ